MKNSKILKVIISMVIAVVVLFVAMPVVHAQANNSTLKKVQV